MNTNSLDKKLNKNVCDNFREWLELNIESITWEGRYVEDFERFWQNLFVPEESISFHANRILFAKKKASSGPLETWFGWLFDKFLCYVFLTQGLSLRNLASLTSVEEGRLSLILREFFIERYPHLEEEINSRFQLGNVTSPNLYLTFADLSQELGLEQAQRGSLGEEVLASLEVTLYPDWREIFESLVKVNEKENHQADSVKKRGTYKKQKKFFQELAILFLIGGMLILAIKVGNKYYEDYLAEKISLFEPNFFWLDKSLSFKAKDPVAASDVELSYKELEKLEKLESKKVFDDNIQTQRFDVESDVALTSVDALPKDFTVADLEQSDYEEVRKGGYRNSRYGRRLAYRVMMTSVDPALTKQKLLNVLQGFEVKQADNVKPGTHIPGGLYFNLYVQREDLKEFLSRVSNVEESTILESKTVFGAPKGTNKVFIWIKSI